MRETDEPVEGDIPPEDLRELPLWLDPPRPGLQGHVLVPIEGLGSAAASALIGLSKRTSQYTYGQK